MSPDLGEMERRWGGRIGVHAIDTGSDWTLSYRADERFALCSTFKWVLAAAVLERVDRAQLLLEQPIAYDASDLLEYAPVAREHVADGSLPIEVLLRAAAEVSDNTAANLLLARIGGPSGLTQIMRSWGDTMTRLDRPEPMLNSNEPGDPRDSTSPRAMVALMRTVLCGSVLSTNSRERLLGWMRSSETGKNRVRAGLPGDWIVGDKTGSGARNAVNDVVIAEPPGSAPVLVAVYMSGSAAPLDALESAHADIGRLITREL